MSFRAVFILLNAVLLLAFLFIVSVPALILGRSYATLTEMEGATALLPWLPAVLFALALGGIDTYFIRNWRLFTLLDRQDWPGAVGLLERDVLQRGRVRSLPVRMLANGYVLTGQAPRIRELETVVRQRRPQLHARLSVQLGLPYLLGDPGEAVAYFSAAVGKQNRGRRGTATAWLQWDLAFSCLRLEDHERAAAALADLRATLGAGGIAASHRQVLQLMERYATARLLAGEGSPAAAAQPGAGGSTQDGGSTQIERALHALRHDLHVVMFGGLLDDARKWAAAGDAGDRT